MSFVSVYLFYIIVSWKIVASMKQANGRHSKTSCVVGPFSSISFVRIDGSNKLQLIKLLSQIVFCTSLSSSPLNCQILSTSIVCMSRALFYIDSATW